MEMWFHQCSFFSRKNHHDLFVWGRTQDCIGKEAPSAWINDKLFIKYLDHFAINNQCSKKNMMLLILNNHESNISLTAIDKCRELEIVLLSIPPHKLHYFQPVDKSVFGPFKNACNSAIKAWIRSNPGKTATIYNIPNLVT